MWVSYLASALCFIVAAIAFSWLSKYAHKEWMRHASTPLGIMASVLSAASSIACWLSILGVIK